MKRRDFVKLTGSALTGSALAGSAAASLVAAAPARAASPAPQLKKAVKFGMVRTNGTVLDKFKLLKDLGYDGVEMQGPDPDLDRNEVLRARDATGLPIHGVVDAVHWRQTLGDPDPKVRAAGVEGLRGALEDAKAYGATTVLLVPAVVNKEISYADAYTRSQAEIRKVIPLAEEYGIAIAFENVWNNFLLSPLEFARYIDEFESPWIGAYFDIGNIVNYGWPEHWIQVLGPRIMKLDIKGFSLEMRDKEGPRAGFRAEIGDDSVDWAAVRRELAKIQYNGWATAEVQGGDEDRLREIAARMDRYVLGKTQG